MKIFKCDSKIYCAKCYLDILTDSEYQHLVISFTQVADVDNDCRCDNCNILVSSKESLNAFKKIVEIIEQ